MRHCQLGCQFGHQQSFLVLIVLMFHCINDPDVSVENSRTLYRKLDEKNHSVEYYEIKDWEEHGGNIYFSETVLSIIQDFIKKTK